MYKASVSPGFAKKIVLVFILMIFMTLLVACTTLLLDRVHTEG
jgi:hypothetical protein